MTHLKVITASTSTQLSLVAPSHPDDKLHANSAKHFPLPQRVERLLAIIAEVERQAH